MKKITLFAFIAVSVAAFAEDPIIGPQIRIDVAGTTWAANESSAASFDPSGKEIVGTWNDWRRSTSIANEIINMGVAVSNNNGASWVDFLVRPPAANQSNVEGDPMTAYDNRTGTLWVAAISFAGNGGIYVAKKDPGANAFQASVMAHRGSGDDKCWMGAGPRPGDPNNTNVYIAFNLGSIRSEDMGATWSTPVGLASGIGFLPRVGPEGNLYISYWDFGTGHWLKRSTDGGRTFTTVRIATRMDTWGTQDGSRFPGNFRVPPMNTLAVDPVTGVLYAIYFDTTNIVGGNRNVDLYLTKSTDTGLTWSTPHIINQDATPPGDQFFPWLEVDYKGRLNVTWWDSRNTVQNDSTANTNGFFDNYFGYSDDGGQTWTEFRLTPNSWNCFNDGLSRSQQFLGDYNALAQGGNWCYPCYLSTQNGDPDIFTNRIMDPEVGARKLTIQRGSLVSGNLRDTYRSDDSRLTVANGAVAFPSESPITVVFDSFSPLPSPGSFSYRLEAQTSIQGLTQRIDLYDFAGATFELVDTRPASPNADMVTTVNIGANNSRFIEPGSQAIRARARFRFDGPALTSSWRASIDQAVWRIAP